MTLEAKPDEVQAANRFNQPIEYPHKALAATGGIMSNRALIGVYSIGAIVVVVFCMWMADLAAPRFGRRILFLLFMVIAVAAFVGILGFERHVRRRPFW